VASAPNISLRQGDNGYEHSATFLRADSPDWNSGARDQMLAGKKTGGLPFRPVFSFPLTGVPANATLTGISLDLWTDATAGIGTVGTLELRELTSTPVEGSGSSSTDAANGAGTGATWSHRTQTTPWTTAGGDFNATVLSSVPGFSATATNTQKTFPSTSSFLSIGQAALTAGQPLNLLLISPLSESGANDIYTRLTSDDSALTTQRPRLTLAWTANPAPVVDPGPAPAAITGAPSSLTATTTGANSTAWSLVSGPGSAAFGNSTQPATTVTFSQPGSYLLRLTADNANGEISRTLAVVVNDPLPTLDPAIFADWQSITWPNTNAPETIGPDMDPDHDGLPNLLEWALHLDATASSPFLPVFDKDGSVLSYTYTRRKTAPGEATFQVEWSDTLGDDWSTVDVGEEIPISETDSTRTVKVTIPNNSDRNFVRLRVSRP
jgi:hypothetical protein